MTVGKRRAVWVEVSLSLDLARLEEQGLKPEERRVLMGALFNDGRRRLGQLGIAVDSAEDIEHPDRFVYCCPRRSAARIRRFLSSWSES